MADLGYSRRDSELTVTVNKFKETHSMHTRFQKTYPSKSAPKPPMDIKDIGDPITIPTSDDGAAQVQVKELKGRRYIDVRHFYFDKGKSRLSPTTKGLWIPMNHASAVAEAISALIGPVKA